MRLTGKGVKKDTLPDLMSHGIKRKRTQDTGEWCKKAQRGGSHRVLLTTAGPDKSCPQQQNWTINRKVKSQSKGTIHKTAWQTWLRGKPESAATAAIGSTKPRCKRSGGTVKVVGHKAGRETIHEQDLPGGNRKYAIGQNRVKKSEVVSNDMSASLEQMR
jgi:hypothetical protein